MNRTFQGKITLGILTVFLSMLFMTFYFGWNKSILALPLLIGVIVLLERMLHTSFIITSNGFVIIHKGRFSRDIKIDIQTISRIEKGKSIYSKLGISYYLNIILNDGKRWSVWPSDEVNFIDCIKKKHNSKNQMEEE